MPLIEQIHTRLIAWGDWVIRGRNVGRNGYPSQSAFARLTPGAGPSAWSPSIDFEAEEVDRCIRGLDAEARDLVTRYYTRQVTTTMLAREFGCSSGTLFKRLTAAQVAILQLLESGKR